MGLFSRDDRRGFWREMKESRSGGSANSLNNPSTPLSSDSIVAVLGTGFTTDAGVNVGETNAMRLTAAYRAVQVIAGTVASLPRNVYLSGPPNLEGAVDKTIVNSPLLQQPYPDMTGYEWVELICTHLLLWGNAFCLKVPNQLGTEIVRLLPLLPYDVTPQRRLLPDGQAYGPKVYQMSPRIGGGYLTDDEILHIPGLGYDGIRGLSPVALCRQAFGLGIAAEEAASRLYGNGNLLGGVLQTDQKLNQDQADQIKLRWRERISGLARAHEVAVLDQGMRFQPVAMPARDAQFLESRDFQTSEVARIFGVPPHLLMDLDKTSSWGQGVAEQSLGFVRFTLGFWLKRLEERIDMGVLPPGQHFEFDFRGLLRGDTAARYQSYLTGLAGKFLTPNEVRRWEGLPPIPGGDDIVDVQAPTMSPAAVAPKADTSGKAPKGV